MRAWILGLGLLIGGATEAADPADNSARFALAARPLARHLLHASDVATAFTHGFTPVEFAIRRSTAWLVTRLDVPREADSAWARLQQWAVLHGKPRLELMALQARGDMDVRIGNGHDLGTLGQRMLSIVDRLGDPAFTASAYQFMGIDSRRRGELEQALAYHRKTLHLRRQLGDRQGEARALSELGWTLQGQGHFAHALALQYQALQIQLNHPDPDRLALAHRHLALLYCRIDDIEKARHHFELALEAAHSNASPVTVASVVGSYAVFLNDTGAFEQAHRLSSQAMAIDQALGNDDRLALDRLQAGRALSGLNHLTEARLQLEDAVQAGFRLARTRTAAHALLVLARIDMANTHLDAAERRIDQAIGVLDDTRDLSLLTQAWKVREELATLRNDDKAALAALRTHMQLREALVGRRDTQRIEALNNFYQRQHYGERIRALTSDNAMNLARLEQHRHVRNLAIGLAAALILLLGLIWNRYRFTHRLNRALAHKNHEVEAARRALEDVNATLLEQSRKLYRLATRDPLTGVFNRRHMLQQLENRIERGCDVSVLLIDFDHFKQINDRLGHLFGDRVLRTGTRCMRKVLPAGQLVGRFGGEEFLVALCDITHAEAGQIAEDLRANMTRALANINPEPDEPITVSIGVATLSQCQPRTLKNLLGSADHAMYQAKADGRNRVHSHLDA